jgi:two-component system, OmpR family, sensor histidine kinase MprB
MTLRKRLSLIAAASVGIAVLIAVVGCYMLVRHQLRTEVDNSLQAQAQAVLSRGQIALGEGFGGFGYLPPNAGGPAPYAQIVAPDGNVQRSQGGVTLPIGSRTSSIIANATPMVLQDVWVGGSHLRMITFHDTLTDGTPVAVEIARPLGAIDNTLADLRLVLALLLAGGIAMAAALGRLASRRVLAPLAEVADVAQQIAETDDLSKRLHVHAGDEVGQLARNFNAMLDRLESSRAALDESVRAQRQLVADASHELRTPVTSLRTNIEVLLEGAELDPEDRRRLLADVVEQSEELSALVNDLIELARGDERGAETDDVRLDGVAEESLARARRNAPGIRFDATLVPTLVDGVPERLARAINNLLDNAARHSPPGGTVEVQVGPKGVEVRDHGTGVDPEDLPYVFDRFFRGRNSRGRQGSGLGLAIVRQVAQQHDGSVSVTNAVDGGAIFNLWLPGIPADTADDHPDAAAPAGGTAGAPAPGSSEPVKTR